MPMPPENPENFDKVNFVIDMWSQPCEAPWYIYLQTLKPAALEAFIVLISFGWADVLRGALRPKGLGRRTSKRKGRWNRRIPRFPETGNTIGKKLPFAEQVSDWITWGTKTKFLWRIDNAMQAGLFMWLVADVAEDFAFNWTSLLYKTYWCRESHLGRFSWQHTTMSTSNGHVWQVWRYPTMDYQRSPPSWSGTIGATGPNGAQVAATITIATLPPFDPPNGVKVRITNRLGLRVFAETEGDEPDEDGSWRLPVMARLGPNEIFEVRVWHDSAWASVGVGVVMAVENEVH